MKALKMSVEDFFEKHTNQELAKVLDVAESTPWRWRRDGIPKQWVKRILAIMRIDLQ
jgi:hypothetical protein